MSRYRGPIISMLKYNFLASLIKCSVREGKSHTLIAMELMSPFVVVVVVVEKICFSSSMLSRIKLAYTSALVINK